MGFPTGGRKRAMLREAMLPAQLHLPSVTALWNDFAAPPPHNKRDSAACLVDMEEGGAADFWPESDNLLQVTLWRKEPADSLGLHIDAWTGELVVTAIYEGELAHGEGSIRAGDVILAANGESCERSIKELKRIIAGCRRLHFKIRRPVDPYERLNLIESARTAC